MKRWIGPLLLVAICVAVSGIGLHQRFLNAQAQDRGEMITLHPVTTDDWGFKLVLMGGEEIEYDGTLFRLEFDAPTAKLRRILYYHGNPPGNPHLIMPPEGLVAIETGALPPPGPGGD